MHGYFHILCIPTNIEYLNICCDGGAEQLMILKTEINVSQLYILHISFFQCQQ